MFLLDCVTCGRPLVTAIRQLIQFVGKKAHYSAYCKYCYPKLILNNREKDMTASSNNPGVPAVEAVEAIGETIATPSIASIVNDFETFLALIDEVKTKLAGLNPSFINILKALF
jgi:hypothetical protein